MNTEVEFLKWSKSNLEGYSSTDKSKEIVEPRIYRNSTNTMAVALKSRRLQELVTVEPTEDQEFKKVFENLDEKYIEQQAKTTMLGTEMLKAVLQLLTKSGADSVKITVDNDFPVRFSTDDFGVIIAPRVED